MFSNFEDEFLVSASRNDVLSIVKNSNKRNSARVLIAMLLEQLNGQGYMI